MNKLNIASTGYPGTTESWKFLSEMNSDLSNIIGKLINNNAQNVLVPGRKVIITGLSFAQNQISDGYISVNGEVYRFYGGANTGTIVLVEEVMNVEYNTDPANSGQLQSLPTYYKRYAKPGNPGEGFQDIALSDFVRLDALIDISERTKQATESKKGIAEIATQQEVDDGVDDTKIVTPKKLNTFWTSGIEKQIVDITSTGLTQIYLNNQIPNTDYIIVGSLHNNMQTFYRYNIREKYPSKFIIDVQSTDGSSGNINTKFEFMVMRL